MSMLIHGYLPESLMTYAECTPLYQLIKLINSLKEDKDDIILSNV